MGKEIDEVVETEVKKGKGKGVDAVGPSRRLTVPRRRQRGTADPVTVRVGQRPRGMENRVTLRDRGSGAHQQFNL